jgi:hypothetical protein
MRGAHGGSQRSRPHCCSPAPSRRAAHDMFVQPARFFADENADVVVRVLNGTFAKSQNSIDRARLADVSVVSPDGRQRLDTAVWSVAGDTSTFVVRTSGRTAAGARIAQRSTRSDGDGIARIPLRSRGTWYVKFINMTKLDGDSAADYQSKWATLTFQLR